MRIIPLLCILVGFASECVAQQAPAPPPPLGPGPLIARAPLMSKWLISIRTNTGPTIEVPSPATKFDKRTMVTKTGDLRREQSLLADGTQKDQWFTGPFMATINPGSHPTVEMAGANNTGTYVDYSKSDFAGFQWIRRDNYIGHQFMEGIDCIVFHTGGDTTPPPPGVPAPPIPATGSTAFIGSDDRFPVLLEVDSQTTLFTKYPAPSSMQVLPPDVDTIVGGIKQRATFEGAAPPPP